MFKCNVRIVHLWNQAEPLSVVPLAIPDDAMDVDRVADEDKDSDPDKVNASSLGRWLDNELFV